MIFINKNQKFIKVFIIALAFTLIFLKQICEILIKIGSVIDYNDVTFKAGYFLIFGFFIISYVFLLKKKFIHNVQTNFFIIYITVIYILLRFVFLNFIYFESSDIIFTKYSDVIFLIAFLHFLNLFLESEKNNLIKKRDRNDTFFLEDKLYVDSEIDNEKILNKLFEVVSNFKPDVAFSIGINAVWGYGKSSFLHRFKKKYEITNPSGIIFWNRIWKNKGSVAIIENFFEELKDNLKPYSGEISDDINKYVDSILSLSSSDLKKIINTGKDALSENSTLEKFYYDINENIKKIDRQIVVLLDDLDRLEKPEILNTLKLIRTLSDFNNVIFIAGYDRKYIVETIDMPKDNYLDKIFNVEINLLPFDEQLIIDELLRQVDIAFPVVVGESDLVGFNNAFKNLFTKKANASSEVSLNVLLDQNNFSCTSYTLKYQDFLKTYRDVKRFVNEFKFNALFLDSQEDIIAEEYILLKLLTYKYRELQNEIFVSIKSIFDKGTIDDVNNTVQQFGGSSANSVYLYNKEVQEKVNIILDKYPSKDKDIINATLCLLFGKKTLKFYEQNQNSISKTYYTDIYIKNNIVGGQISITQLQSAFEKGELFQIAKDLSNSQHQYQFQLANELKQFIFNNEFNTIDQFKDILKTLNFIILNSSYNDNQKVINLLTKGFETFYKEDKKAFLDNLLIIINNDSIGYLDHLFSSININIKRKESKSFYVDGINNYKNNHLTALDLKLLLLEKLRNAIGLLKSPEVIFPIYNLDLELITIDKKIVHSKQANQAVREDIKLRFIDYIESPFFSTLADRIDETTGEMIGYFPSFLLAQIFSNPKTLDLLLKKPEDSNLFEELQKEGWENLLSFLREIDSELMYYGKIEREKLTRMIRFLTTYKDNNYEPLNKIQYDEIWSKKLRF
jgi:hypothetical protein